MFPILSIQLWMAKDTVRVLDQLCR
jgi:hypothetical protein